MSSASHTRTHVSLREAALAPATHRAYSKHLDLFLTFTRRSLQQLLSMHAGSVDRRLSVYIEHLHHYNFPYENAVHALSGLVYQRQDLRTKLGESRLRLRGWHRIKTTVSHPPITWELTVVIAVTLANAGHHGEAVACLLAFDCYLRVGELTNLTLDDVVRRNDPRYGRRFTAMALRLAKTKTGLNQWVSVRSSAVSTLLTKWTDMRLGGRSASGADLVFPFSTAHFRRMLHRACDAAGLGDIPYVPHSFRHGGATADFLGGMSIEKVMYHGRWKAMESARRYIQTGRALLATQHVPVGLVQLGITLDDSLAPIMSELLDTVPLVTPGRQSRAIAAPRRRRVTFDL